MQAARKAEDEHEQEKYNNSCASKSGVVSDVLMGHEGNTNPDPKTPTWELLGQVGWDTAPINGSC